MAYDWQWASDFLAGGRKKHERPLYDRGLRLWKTNKWDVDSDINVGWHSYQPFVIYHKDGSTTMQAVGYGGQRWVPLGSQSVRLTMMRYAGVQSVYQRNYKYYIVEQDAGLTPPKVQGCRQCKQRGTVDTWCWPGNCWNIAEADGKFYCPQHPETDSSLISPNRRWHSVPCEHGDVSRGGHEVKDGATCYGCGGTRKRDYGSKYVATLWDGSPIRIRDGKLIKSAAGLLERMIADYVEPIA